MTPYLTPYGKTLLGTSLAWLICSALLLLMGRPTAWPLLIASSALLLLLLVGFMSAVPIGWILDRNFLTLRIVLPSPESQSLLFTSETISPKLEITNLSALRLRNLQLQPELSTPLLCTLPKLPSLNLPSASLSLLNIPLRAQLSGRWFVHGFHIRCRDALNLFEVSDYLPVSQPLRFFPRGAISRRPLPTAALVTVQDRVGLHELPYRGSGSSLREIREHQHGDPFRNIAWKATARAGRLMVREFEREVALNAFILLDISTSMRGLTPLGGSKLEHGMRLATGFGHMLLRGANRCGLITFDDQIYGHLPPREGSAQLTRISQHLLGLNNIVDKNFTAFDDHEVTDALVRYLLIQERLDFRQRQARTQGIDPSTASTDDLYDIPLLDRWLYRQVALLEATHDNPSMHAGIVNDNEDLSLQRQYCQLRGIELPYRGDARFGSRERGLVEATELVLSSSRDPHLLLIISDLNGILNHDRFVKVCALARTRRHRVVVFSPLTPLYTPTPKGEREAILFSLLSASESRERQAISRALQRVNTPTIDIGPDADATSLLRMMKLWR